MSKVIKDGNQWLTDESTWNTDSNAIVNPSNALAQDGVLSSQFSSDLSVLQNAYSKFSEEDSNLQTDVSTLNTDGQLISSTKIEGVINDLEKALTQFDSDTNSMSASMNDEIYQAQREKQAFDNGRYQYSNILSSSDEWNKAIVDTGAQQSTIRSDIAKLRAYQPQNTNASSATDQLT